MVNTCCLSLFLKYIYMYIYIHTHTHIHTHIYLFMWYNNPMSRYYWDFPFSEEETTVKEIEDYVWSCRAAKWVKIHPGRQAPKFMSLILICQTTKFIIWKSFLLFFTILCILFFPFSNQRLSFLGLKTSISSFLNNTQHKWLNYHVSLLSRRLERWNHWEAHVTAPIFYGCSRFLVQQKNGKEDSTHIYVN